LSPFSSIPLVIGQFTIHGIHLVHIGGRQLVGSLAKNKNNILAS